MGKKLAKIMAVITIFGVLSSSNLAYAYASQEDNESWVLDSSAGLNLDDYKAEAARLLQLGQQLSQRRDASILGLSGVPNLKQSNSAWASCIMQSQGLTIGSAGCCLTSFTNIQQYYGGTDTPDLVNTTMGNAACPFEYYTAASHYDLNISLCLMTNTSSYSYADTLSYVKAAVQEGHPVLIGMKSSSTTHFVVAFAYAYNNIIIRDPASVDYTYLSQYTDNGYSVNRIIIYEE